MTFNGRTVDRVSKVKWDGDKLVMTMTSNVDGNTVETTRTWAIDRTGNLVVERMANLEGISQATRATYKKTYKKT